MMEEAMRKGVRSRPRVEGDEGDGGFDHGDKLVVCMVGLPARCKSFIARKIKRFFNWMTIKAEVFNAGQRRRKEVAGKQGSEWFDKDNTAGFGRREQLALDTLQAALEFLLWENGRVAVFDATNTTRKRRTWVRDLLMRAKQEHGVRFLFVESVFERPEMVQQNVLEKMDMSPDWANMNRDAAEQDMWRRIHNYEAAYQPVAAEEALPYLRVVNFEHACLTNLDLATACPLVKLTVAYVCSIHNGYRPITFTTEGAGSKPSRCRPSAERHEPCCDDNGGRSRAGNDNNDNHEEGEEEEGDDDDTSRNRNGNKNCSDAEGGCELDAGDGRTTADPSQAQPPAPAPATTTASTAAQFDAAMTNSGIPRKPDGSAVDCSQARWYASGVWQTGGKFSCNVHTSAAFWAPLATALTSGHGQQQQQQQQEKQEKEVEEEKVEEEEEEGQRGRQAVAAQTSSRCASTRNSNVKAADGADSLHGCGMCGSCKGRATKQRATTTAPPLEQKDVKTQTPSNVPERALHDALDALLEAAPLLSACGDRPSRHAGQQACVADALPKALEAALSVTDAGAGREGRQHTSTNALLLGERDALARSMGSEFTMPNSPRTPGTPTPTRSRSRVSASSLSSVATERHSTEPAIAQSGHDDEQSGGAQDTVSRGDAHPASKHVLRGTQAEPVSRVRVNQRSVPSLRVEDDHGDGDAQKQEGSDEPAEVSLVSARQERTLPADVERCVSLIRRLLEIEACTTSATAVLPMSAHGQEGEDDDTGNDKSAASARAISATAAAVLLSYYDYDGHISATLAALGAATITPFHTEGSAAWTLAKAYS